MSRKFQNTFGAKRLAPEPKAFPLDEERGLGVQIRMDGKFSKVDQRMLYTANTTVRYVKKSKCTYNPIDHRQYQRR